jgi:hypothetical protein
MFTSLRAFSTAVLLSTSVYAYAGFSPSDVANAGKSAASGAKQSVGDVVRTGTEEAGKAAKHVKETVGKGVGHVKDEAGKIPREGREASHR